MDLDVVRVGNSSVITVRGEIDVENGYPLFMAAVKEAENGSAQVVFELSGVTFVDSVGLGQLIRSRDELAEHFESALVLRNPSRRVQSLLDITATRSTFTIDETPASA